MKKRVFVIAEAGVNHNGNIKLAEKMIWEAKKSGADAIKFQTYKTDNLISKFAPKAEYQERETGTKENQKEMLKKLELSYEAFRHLKGVADSSGIMFLSSPFDLDSIEFLKSLNMPFWKIPSGEITNLPYLERIAETKKPVIISTGMSDMQEIENALQIFTKAGLKNGDISLLHCTTEYPAPIESVNLKVINTFQKHFGVKAGYSDHTMGIEVPIAAVAIGAEIIEKHFTLDKNSEGPDHKASLTPNELQAMITAIRKVELCLGTGEKIPSQTEIRNRIAARKSIVAKKTIQKGEILSIENISVKRPGNGISPMLWHKVLGTRAVKDFEIDELIE